jgi:hypothetical protein
MVVALNLDEFVIRIKRASAGEIAYRIRKKLTARKIKSLLKQNRSPFAVPSIDSAQVKSLEMPTLSMQARGDLIKRLINGKTFHLNANPEEIRQFEDVHRDTFSNAVKIQPGEPDIRAIWEPSRLQHSTLLLLSDRNAGAEHQAGKEVVLKWIQANPFLRGAHYMSAMECGLRVPVFFYCLKKTPDLSEAERNLILRATYEHAWWVEHNLSLYASLGNHTVCECVGLIFAGSIFRDSGEGRNWLGTGCRLLDQELTHQVLPDGGPAEQSLSYHRFVLDLYWLAADFLEKNGLRDCAHWKAPLFKGEIFLGAFRWESGLLPSIGDSDDGHAVAPGAGPLRGKPEAADEAVTTFPESGYTVIREKGGLVLTFDHGPLGMAPLYNHGHADALSITLSFDSKPIIVDSGTYRYNGVLEWRRYFKGTRAHNTVMVDDQDQAVQESSFIWSKPHKAVLNTLKGGGGWTLLAASHDGYKRLSGRVIHERTVFFEKGSRILIKDSFKGSDWHDFELNFHLHPDTVLEETGEWIKVWMGNITAYIRLVEGGSFEVIKGQDDPIHGWYSPAYGLKLPSPVLTCRVRKPTGEAQFVTVFSLGGPCDVNELKNRYRQIEQQARNS